MLQRAREMSGNFALPGGVVALYAVLFWNCYYCYYYIHLTTFFQDSLPIIVSRHYSIYSAYVTNFV